jgi:hypothetical protein
VHLQGRRQKAPRGLEIAFSEGSVREFNRALGAGEGFGSHNNLGSAVEVLNGVCCVVQKDQLEDFSMRPG